MKRLLTIALLTASAVFAQNSQFGGLYRAMAYAYGAQGGPQALQVSTGTTATGAGSIRLTYGRITLNDGTPYMPFATNAPIQVGSEIVTPSSVSCSTVTVVDSCTVNATFSQMHYRGETVSSATVGLQEALNAANAKGGGSAMIDGAWAAAGGTSAMVSAAVTYATTVIYDNRTGSNAGSFLQAGTGAVARSFQAKNQDIVSVKDFGAKGDGTTDDTVAVQSALDFAYTNGVQLYFPAGTYFVSTLKWRGESFSGSTINASVVKGKPGQDVFATTDPADAGWQSPLQYTHIHDISIYVDGTVDAHASFTGRTTGTNTTANYSWTVGNCGIAIPDRDGSKGAGFIGNHMTMNNVFIYQYNGVQQGNNTCSVWSQVPFNDATFRDSVFRFTQFGIINTPPVTNVPLFAPDANHFNKLGIYTLVPFVWYGGGHTTMDNIQMYASSTGALGPFILNPPPVTYPSASTSPSPAAWLVNGIYVENASATTGELMQVDGGSHVFTAGSFKQDEANNSYVQWNASDSRVINVGVGNVTASPSVMNITGSRNIMSIETQVGFLTPPVNNTGTANVITVSNSSVNSANRGLAAGPTKAKPISSLDASFLLTGNTNSPYLNLDDLLLTTDDFPSSACSAIGYDATAAPASSYCRVTNTSGAFGIRDADGLFESLIVGSRVPANKMTVYMRARSNAGSSTQVVFVTDSASTSLGSATLNWTTSFTTQSFTIDATSAVSWVQLQSNNNSINSTEDVAWVAFVPQLSTYTFGSGLTNTSGTVTADSATGKSGGQTLVGGLNASDVLTLKSTLGVGTGHTAAIALTYGNNGANSGLTLFEDGSISGGPNGTLGLQSFASGNDGFSSNLYYNGSAFVYKTANAGDMIQMNGGNMSFQVAPLGSAGGSATLSTVLKLSSSNTITVGVSGVALTRLAKYTAALTPASVAANTCAEQTFTVTGIAASDIVYGNKPTSQAGLGVSGVRASATNTVGINYCNTTAAAITPTAETYSFGVIQ